MAAAACFGAPHNAWWGSPRHVSLMRELPAPCPLTLAAEPAGVQLDLRRSALVVIDMQNDFCHPQGWFAQRGIDITACRRPIPVIAQLAPAWRAAGGRVLWLNWGIRADLANLPPGVLYKGKGGNAAAVGYGEISPEDHGPSLVQGSWGAGLIDGLQADPADLLIYKHRLSGFFDSELDGVLRAQGITSLLFAGINTDRCVYSTLQDAAFLGYDCLLVRDACDTPSPAHVSDAIHFLVRLLHGFLTDSAALTAALAGLSTPTPQPSRDAS
ncbi:MAG: isochorismatase [Candidatus Dactylopiibacterium carminicum]|uniref:Isochorismatase n=2 Tax=Candidatus Dactylopiibacterium carminicum TaxID=857335 RepID=A0A272ERX1_9RHOO|nr:isochorismatase [Candidatus Dactylopiibacterium carminicum]PAS92786.1 MAG: isochorismatase [Candidatus Dactylopiibacterium carminicum]PAS96235.1 MAG: isochorismatase [Candidatus Dactylopiibacterium carminicum]PAS98886.1 MAG: isochorismatase [Candidatus Dactylopiibacterium carminicum]